MEKKLKALFDYQRFEKNARLEKLISETGDRYTRELDDNELGLVNAAGEFTVPGGTIGGNPADAGSWYGVDDPEPGFDRGSRLPPGWINGNSQE